MQKQSRIRIKVAVICSIIAISMLLTPMSSFASSNVGSYDDANDSQVVLANAEKKEIRTEQLDVVEALDEEFGNVDASDLAADRIDAVTKTLLKENYTSLGEIASNENRSGDVINLPTKEYDINDNISIAFEDQYIILDVLEESPERDATQTTGEMTNDSVLKMAAVAKAAKGSGAKTKTASHVRYIYDATVKSWKLVTCSIEAEFTYNKSKGTCTARRMANYMKANVPFISVYSKESAIQKPSKARRVAYQSGYASLGINYKGNGIVFQTRWMRVNVECNSKGEIKRSSTVKK